MNASKDIDISGTVGTVKSTNSNGLYASGSITISGTVGTITCSSDDATTPAIYAKNGITLDGQYILLPENGVIGLYDTEYPYYTVLDGDTPAQIVRSADTTVTVPADKENPEEGGSLTIPAVPVDDLTITVTVPAIEGYDPTVTVTDGNGNPVDVTKNDDGTYTFPMPADQEVTITVTYTKIAEEEEDKEEASAKFFFPNTFLLNFEENGGSEIKSVARALGSTNSLAKFVPTREGYTFTGWYADRALTEAIEKVVMTGPVTVYAGWEKIG